MKVYVRLSFDGVRDNVAGVYATEEAARAADTSGHGGDTIREHDFDDPVIGLVRRLVAAGCHAENYRGVEFCHFCRALARNSEPTPEYEHEPDCPWVAAKAFLDGLGGETG